jgi:Zn-dependent protease
VEDRLTNIIVSLPAFLLAIILHELAHGYVAYRLGDDTAKRAGRLTMSPLAHLDPIGTLLFLISAWAGVGFGWAKPVPVVTANLRNPRRDDILVSLAGVTANLAQAIVWAVLFRLAVSAVHVTGAGLAVTLARFCMIGVEINILLMIFNLLPIPPLDGSHVAVQVFGIRDPYTIERLRFIGFIVLLGLLTTGAFGTVWYAVGDPIVRVMTGMSG